MKQATFHDECREIAGMIRDVQDRLEDLANRANPGQRDMLRPHIQSHDEAHTDLADAIGTMEAAASIKRRKPKA